MKNVNFQQKNLFLSKSIYQNFPVSKPFLEKINLLVDWDQIGKDINLFHLNTALYPYNQKFFLSQKVFFYFLRHPLTLI